ncbi:hypothetical protein HI914_03699 [Erysiphe necator]|nr:hypothetical protein HI914_03699 [Erysiphe necator]
MSFGPFTEVLNLEQDFFQSGFEQGLIDGEAAGRLEGRTLGLEKGFEKFCEAGRLYGRSLIWANQQPYLPPKIDHETKKEDNVDENNGDIANQVRKSHVACTASISELDFALPPIPNYQKLSQRIKSLHDLMEPETLSFENTEEAMSDFDDRLKKARAKLRLIQKLIDEQRVDQDGKVKGAKKST